MVCIKIKRGLDIPIKGDASGEIKNVRSPKKVALDLNPFDYIRFKLLVRIGDRVKIGEALAEDKNCLGRVFVSPGCGTIVDILRGEKRRLLKIIIELDKEEKSVEFKPLDVSSISRDQIIDRLKESGLFAHIKMRPFNIVAHPDAIPRSIFVKAVESAPFVPPPGMQLVGFEREFKEGLAILNKLTNGKVHLVYDEKCTEPLLLNADSVEKHTASGPHPRSSQSIHISHLDPIKSNKDVIWTVNLHDVICIGSAFFGKYHIERVVSVAGEEILPEKREFLRLRAGFPISEIVENRLEKRASMIISGDPLCGLAVLEDDFLGFSHFTFCALPEEKKRKMSHFFRFFSNRFTATRTYFNVKGEFTSSRHGEPRAFLDTSIYDKVMPMNIPVVLLVKAIISEEFETAEELGLLEVDSEDFSLPAFICPSKVEMVDIVRQGLKKYYKEFFEL